MNLATLRQSAELYITGGILLKNIPSGALVRHKETGEKALVIRYFAEYPMYDEKLNRECVYVVGARDGSSFTDYWVAEEFEVINLGESK